MWHGNADVGNARATITIGATPYALHGASIAEPLDHRSQLKVSAPWVKGVKLYLLEAYQGDFVPVLSRVGAKQEDRPTLGPP